MANSVNMSWQLVEVVLQYFQETIFSTPINSPWFNKWETGLIDIHPYLQTARGPPCSEG